MPDAEERENMTQSEPTAEEKQKHQEELKKQEEAHKKLQEQIKAAEVAQEKAKKDQESLALRIEEATKFVNEYLETKGLELQVTHNVTVIPKRQVQRTLPVTTKQ